VTSRDVLEPCSAAELRLNSLYLQCMDSHKADVMGALSKQEVQSSECQTAASGAEVLLPAEGALEHYSTPKIPLSANVPGTAADSNECQVGLSDTYLSPTSDSNENISLATKDTGDSPHSIVYQNEEGKWVTDLAYYTSFDEEQDLNLSEDDKINEEFIS
ncbi:CE192 protein, partial [Penelope pileata]|nr:CE192 protein [Penelope pileata]